MRLPGASYVTSATRRVLSRNIQNRSGPRQAGSQSGSKLLDALDQAGAAGQVTMLATRAADHTSLDNPDAVARLLDRLDEAGIIGQVTTLADRAAAQARLDGSGRVGDLLDALRRTGTSAQRAQLIARLPAAGQFALFREQNGDSGHFRFGREPDGTPATGWGWTDLD